MTNKRLSELPAGSAISAADLFYTTQDLTSVSVTGAQLLAYAGGGGGSGDVVGPASATNNGFAVYDGTTGKLIKNHAATVSLASEVSGNLPVANLNGGTSASGTTFWRGDGTWATPSGGGGGGSTILDGSGLPASGLGSPGDYYVDNDGNVMYGPKSASGLGPVESIISTTTPISSAGASYMLGNDFNILMSGYVTGLRFWRDAGSSISARTIKLFITSSQTLLGSVSTTAETGSGWIAVNFSSPIFITAPLGITVTIDVSTAWAEAGGGPALTDPTHATWLGGRYSVFPAAFPANPTGSNYFTDILWQVGTAVTWPIAVGGGTIGAVVEGALTNGVLFTGSGGVLAQDSTFQFNTTTKDLQIGGRYRVGTNEAVYMVANATADNWFEGDAGNISVSGYGNFGTGTNALSAISTGNNNVGIGTNALQLVTTGSSNTAFGTAALGQLTSGDQNTAVGNQAMLFSVSASFSFALGAQSLLSSIDGANNVAIGAYAMNSSQHDSNCIAVGSAALVAFNGGGGNHVAVGDNAGRNLTTGASNTFIGRQAGFNVTGGGSNTWIGGYRGLAATVNDTIALTLGHDNIRGLDYNYTNAGVWSFHHVATPIGLHVYKTTNGDAGPPPTNYERAVFDWNVASNVLTIGTQAGGTGVLRPVNIIGSALTFNGSPIGGGGSMAIGGAITSATAGSVLFAGAAGVLAQDNANFTFDATTKQLNINASDSGAGGYFTDNKAALYRVPNASYGDNWFEDNAGNFSTTGYKNLGTGDLALTTLTSGYRNLAFGSEALKFCTSGFDNTAIGTDSLKQLTTGYNNTAFGTFALSNLTTGVQNFAFGYYAMGNTTTGSSNVAIGATALFSAAALGGNVAIGDSAMGNVTGGGNSVALGTNAAGGSMTVAERGVFLGIECGYNLTASYNSTWLGNYRGIGVTTSNSILFACAQYAAMDFQWITANTWSLQWIGGPVGLHLYKTINATDATYTNYERGMLDWNATSNVFRLGTQAGGTGVVRLMAIDGFAKAGAPAAGDLPSGSFAVIDDTSAGQTWLVFNKAGTIRKVQLT